MSAPSAARERRVALDGLHNFRDLGGYAAAGDRRVRWGRLYRSDALHRMTGDDVVRVRALGVTSVIDLRAPDEVGLVGVGRIDELDVRYRNLPTRPAVLAASADEDLDAPPPSAAEHYYGYLSEGRDSFAAIVHALAEPTTTPAVFFCNAGKDRTGVVAAMLLGLLGVDDEVVADDYARTGEALSAIYAATRRDYPVDVKAWRNLSPDMRYANAETMLEFLALVRDRAGGWVTYVQSIGVASETVDAMRESLLEPHLRRDDADGNP